MKAWDTSLQREHEHFAQGVDQPPRHRAADTTAFEQHDSIVDRAHQHMIDTDLTQLIDDDQRIGVAWVAQETVQQRRLAAAEKTGQNGHPDTSVCPASV
ncbi:hypothetical protein FYB63_07085 [Bordetella holmesii]|nr:hypothetical protein H558_13210 [Bordetella holmesii H558]AOB35271.1 hypothetical protein BBB42_06980 [Bordetella holmesii]QJP61439.1 hypothetical protein FYB63_07085 [Bordetella holmesii]